MSGGAAAGHPHPKELLVIRNDGSSVAYHAFRVGRLAVGDGEVVAEYNVELVRVTSSSLVPLVTSRELASLLHTRSTAVMDMYDLRVDARGDVYFIASVLRRRPGCQNLTLERTAGGAIQVRGSAALRRNHICS